MKRMIAIALALGTVPPVLAQSDTGLFFKAPTTLSPAQPSITVHLWAQFGSRDYLAFAGAELDVRASEPGWSEPRPQLHGPGATPGVITGSDITGVISGQLHFPPGGIYADPSNPIEIWRATFTVTDFTPRTISLTTETGQFALYPRIPETPQPRDWHEALHEIRVIPAPGALGVLGLGGACAVRRRARVAGCGRRVGSRARIRLRPAR